MEPYFVSVSILLALTVTGLLVWRYMITVKLGLDPSIILKEADFESYCTLRKAMQRELRGFCTPEGWMAFNIVPLIKAIAKNLQFDQAIILIVAIAKEVGAGGVAEVLMAMNPKLTSGGPRIDVQILEWLLEERIFSDELTARMRKFIAAAPSNSLAAKVDRMRFQYLQGGLGGAGKTPGE